MAAEGDVDEEVRVRDSAIVHTDGCATAANLWFGRIATTYAVVTAVIAIFQVSTSTFVITNCTLSVSSSSLLPQKHT